MKNAKKFKIVFIILAIILFVFIIILSYSNSIKNKNEGNIASATSKTIQSILEKNGCKFYKTENSTLDRFYIDIYTSFKYDLYENEKSNEKFYNNLLEELANFVGYRNFRIIDENTDNSKADKIEIKVFGNGTKIETIFINEIEDYFIFMDSQNDLKKYKKMKEFDLSVESPELSNCIQNDWNSNIDFGTRESIFQNYYIYFDEGIEVRKISGKIYNIVFTQKYQNSVVNGFTVGTDGDIIISKLGTPTFKSKDGNIIGYKTKDFYVFFEKNQISIYRNTEEDYEKFINLVDDFLSEKYTFLDFMNELTDIWPDYEKYEYDSETVFLSYPNKGIDIKLNYNDISGIVLYNNVGLDKKNIEKYLENTQFVAQLQIDNIYNAEVRRVNLINNYSSECKEYAEKYENEDNRNRGNMYDYYMKMSENDRIMGVYFISNNSELMNCELSETINSYIWINEYCFVYSVKGKGIYYYDLKTQIKGTIITGNGTYEIKSYKDNLLEYDESSLEIQY